MPRFLFETASTDGAAADAAVSLAAERFPELAVEHRYSAGEGAIERELWVCRAPSASHIRRWAEAAGLPVGDIQPIQGDAGFRVDFADPSPGKQHE